MNLFQFICSLLIGFCLLVAIVHFLSVRWNAPCDECDAHLVRNVGRSFKSREERQQEEATKNVKSDDESESVISDDESDSDISDDDE